MKKKLTTNIDYFKYAQKKDLKGSTTEIILGFGAKLKREKSLHVNVSEYALKFGLTLLAN